jgi:hypothetical protein
MLGKYYKVHNALFISSAFKLTKHNNFLMSNEKTKLSVYKKTININSGA